MEHLTDHTFQEKTAEGICVVDFSAVWCGPCQMMKPIFEDVAESFKTNSFVRFYQVDVDQCPQSAVRFRVESIPMLVVLKNGMELESRVGVTSASDLKSLIAKALE